MPKQLRVLICSLVLSCLALLTTSSAYSAEPKEWTFLVYMNSDNDLWRFGQMNFAEMERVGSSDQVNIVVQQDPEPRNMPTSRYLVQRNPKSQPGVITSKPLLQMGETDMGDWRTLADFMIWGARNFPAKHYALVVWNHGSGWVGISADDSPKHVMQIPDLRLALETFNKMAAQIQGAPGDGGPVLDIINYDACLMSAMEVAYEFRGQARVSIGSQFLEPGEGQNYTGLLKPLVENPQMSVGDFARVMVYQYSLRYANSSSSEINYLAVDLAKFPKFTAAFSEVAAGILEAPSGLRSELVSSFVNPGDGGGFDLIGVMRAAQRTVGSRLPPLAAKLEALYQMYGYPEDNPVTVNTESGPVRSYRILRYGPGVVNFRYSSDMEWKSIALGAVGDGSYVASIPAPPPGTQLQYVVLKRGLRAGAEVLMQEAVSQIMREGADPIVFHDKFPPQSPVIAESHNFKTKGAHGISLYGLAGMQAIRRGYRALGEALVSDYKRLQFATIGAPAWTQLFGF